MEETYGERGEGEEGHGVKSNTGRVLEGWKGTGGVEDTLEREK